MCTMVESVTAHIQILSDLSRLSGDFGGVFVLAKIGELHMECNE